MTGYRPEFWRRHKRHFGQEYPTEREAYEALLSEHDGGRASPIGVRDPDNELVRWAYLVSKYGESLW